MRKQCAWSCKWSFVVGREKCGALPSAQITDMSPRTAKQPLRRFGTPVRGARGRPAKSRVPWRPSDGEVNMHRTFKNTDPPVMALLVCLPCKARLLPSQAELVCVTCSSHYALVDTPDGRVYDFRIHRPRNVTSRSLATWTATQGIFETYGADCARRDCLEEHFADPFLAFKDACRVLKPVRPATGRVVDRRPRRAAAARSGSACSKRG